LHKREGEMKSESRLQFSPMKKLIQVVLLVVVMTVLAVVILGMFQPTKEFTPASAPAHDSYFPALA
jgi:flagellar basal body-associated protein FliL